MQHAKGYLCARAQETRNVPEPSTRLVILRNPPSPSTLSTPLQPTGRVRVVRVRMTITLVKNKENCGGRILYLPRTARHDFSCSLFFRFLARKKQFLLLESCKMFASDGSSEFIFSLRDYDFDRNNTRRVRRANRVSFDF